jgi:hypothetical protein
MVLASWRLGVLASWRRPRLGVGRVSASAAFAVESSIDVRLEDNPDEIASWWTVRRIDSA